MKVITERRNGILYEKQEQHALLLQEEAESIFLRYALLLQGTERHIFPALALDDWGKEHKSLTLFRWLYEEGQRFPRAEVFGFTRQGQQTQQFLRDIELYFKYPCYAYPRRQTPLSKGRQLQVIMLADADFMGEPEKIAVPAELKWPLRHAAVDWRRANPTLLQDQGWEPVSFI